MLLLDLLALFSILAVLYLLLIDDLKLMILTADTPLKAQFRQTKPLRAANRDFYSLIKQYFNFDSVHKRTIFGN
jgi:hypothetical protein